MPFLAKGMLLYREEEEEVISDEEKHQDGRVKEQQSSLFLKLQRSVNVQQLVTALSSS